MPRLKYWDETSQTWKYADKSVGGSYNADTFIVKIDVDNETASHTPSEIAAAVADGKVVVARCKSDLLFNGMTFHLFSANDTSAVFEYTRSNLADVDTYRYTIDENKTAILSTYSIDIGELSNLETTNKESIVGAINEAASGNGGSEIPTFDLYAMGLPDISLDGSVVSCNCDTTELRSALKKGFVQIYYKVAVGSYIFAPTVFVAFTPVISQLNYHIYFRSLIGFQFYTFKIFVDTDKIQASATEELSGVPAYTEADHGKVLSATADGLTWVEQSVLPDGEEMTF